MKEYKIGEEFEFEGVKLRCDKSTNICSGCVFWSKMDCDTAPDCMSQTRNDDTSVIFVEVQNG